MPKLRLFVRFVSALTCGGCTSQGSGDPNTCSSTLVCLADSGNSEAIETDNPPVQRRKLISRQERTQYLPLMQGSLNTEPASRFCRNLEDSAQGLRREPSSPSPGGAGERVQLAPNCNGSSRANGLALLRWQGGRRRSQ